MKALLLISSMVIIPFSIFSMSSESERELRKLEKYQKAVWNFAKDSTKSTALHIVCAGIMGGYKYNSEQSENSKTWLNDVLDVGYGVFGAITLYNIYLTYEQIKKYRQLSAQIKDLKKKRSYEILS